MGVFIVPLLTCKKCAFYLVSLFFQWQPTLQNSMSESFYVRIAPTASSVIIVPFLDVKPTIG